jgi:hypothetical protein
MKSGEHTYENSENNENNEENEWKDRTTDQLRQGRSARGGDAAFLGTGL